MRPCIWVTIHLNGFHLGPYSGIRAWTGVPYSKLKHTQWIRVQELMTKPSERTPCGLIAK